MTQLSHFIKADRMAGAMLGLAVGDALGAPYEFKPPLDDDEEVRMKKSYRFEAGEWTDDTTMACYIIGPAAAGKSLADESTQDEIVAGWAQWAQSGPPDIGAQTYSVLSRVFNNPCASAVRAASEKFHVERPHNSAGNGSLMRTAPVAIALVDQPDLLWQVAQQISALTHADITAQEACAIWSMAIRTAILEGRFDPYSPLDRLSPERADYWRNLLQEAETKSPKDFHLKNGWVVAAMQGAWSAIYTTKAEDCTHFSAALEAAVRGGFDTDTVGAIAGMLLGARWGLSAIPLEWQLILHGRPGVTGKDLVRLCDAISTGVFDDRSRWPHSLMLDRAQFPEMDARGQLTPQLLLGGQDALASRSEYDAAISLSRVGASDGPADEFHAVVRVLDAQHDYENPNLLFQMRDVADLIERWQSEGKRVLLHCVQAQNRTPAFAAAYLILKHGYTAEEARAEVRKALPRARLDAALNAALDLL